MGFFVVVLIIVVTLFLSFVKSVVLHCNLLLVNVDFFFLNTHNLHGKLKLFFQHNN